MHSPAPLDGLRDTLLRAATLLGVAVWAITESLSLFTAVRPVPLAIAWGIVAAAVVLWARPRLRRSSRMPPFDWIVPLYIAACGAVFIATGITAAWSPPNSADAMAYHLPRVLFWAEQGSVRFFPTQYLNQIMLQPFAEYAMLQSFVLSGGDRWINFGQWTASVLSAVAVSAIARQFGAPARAQAFAALFSAAIPAGILASSGAKNDFVLAFWLVAAVYFAMRWRDSLSNHDAAFLGCALGLALLTKATAYLFAPWPLAVILVRPARQSGARFGRAQLLISACALAVNLPQYARNYQLSGSPFGYSDAFAGGEFRWRNDTFGWKQTLSNMMRNASEQLGARSETWNRSVYDTVLAAHRALSIDPADPATTWKWSSYGPPRNANHEANAPNRLALVILATISCFALWRAAHGQDRLPALYALSLFIAFVPFCAYLKWQPFMARMFLPLFVMAAPLASLVRPLWLQLALCALLLDSARRPALDNWTRPLTGARSVLLTPREQQYFSDMTQWKEDWPAYWAAVDEMRRSGCKVVAIDASHFQLEYPLEALLRQRVPGALFLHSPVRNASIRYPQPVNAPPCAFLCLHCAGGDWRSGAFTIRYAVR